MESCRPRNEEPGLRLTYLSPCAFMASTITSEPYRGLSYVIYVAPCGYGAARTLVAARRCGWKDCGSAALDDAGPGQANDLSVETLPLVALVQQLVQIDGRQLVALGHPARARVGRRALEAGEQLLRWRSARPQPHSDDRR